ncbi:MAG: transglycosylase SLT domain-containing protein [Pyrinomonadaceae bacterium]|nr:transglycosylase SLT domain-containing protein [Pyrinomonadaceae bacterium]
MSFMLTASAQELTRVLMRQPASLLGGGASGTRGANEAARRGRPLRRGPMKIRAREGDTISTLAERFNVPAEDIAELNNLSVTSQLRPRQEVLVPSVSPKGYKASATIVDKSPAENIPGHDGRKSLSLTDGTLIEADEIWESEQGVRYRRGGVTHLVARERVRSIERAETVNQEKAGGKPVVKLVDVSATQGSTQAQPVWIHLVGGARVEADEVTESAAGAWYRRGNLSIYLDRSRIERIEREPVQPPSAVENARSWTERGWSTGNARIDSLIRENGTRYGVDPYLIFCVMEQESHFHPRVVSPKGARGLMQLMPATGAHYGVRNAFDPAQNIMGGTRYLKKLLEQFGGRVDLVLAGYNAGEGAVMKYGRSVPPYKETRNYVKKISARYKQGKPVVTPQTPVSVASRLR